MSKITINGTVITGDNITVNNGKIVVDGKEISIEAKQIKISVEGNINALKVDACNEISVAGDCGSVESASGGIRVGGNVFGDVKTMSGDISCGDIKGNAKTMSGDINRR